MCNSFHTEIIRKSESERKEKDQDLPPQSLTVSSSFPFTAIQNNRVVIKSYMVVFLYIRLTFFLIIVCYTMLLRLRVQTADTTISTNVCTRAK